MFIPWNYGWLGFFFYDLTYFPALDFTFQPWNNVEVDESPFLVGVVHQLKQLITEIPKMKDQGFSGHATV